MPRTARVAPGGYVFHVLNRGNGRLPIFDDAGDYAAFEKTLVDTLAAVPVKLLAYCLMPNHWHLLLKPTEDGQLGRFMLRLTVTHVRRWHQHRHSTGEGHLYQGTYKSFPVQSDRHFLLVARYVERNALRANLVERAEHWRWSSLHARVSSDEKRLAMLNPWPTPRPGDWIDRVNQPMTAAESDAVQTSIKRGRPFGSPRWQQMTAEKLKLTGTFRPRGRPKKKKA